MGQGASARAKAVALSEKDLGFVTIREQSLAAGLANIDCETRGSDSTRIVAPAALKSAAIGAAPGSPWASHPRRAAWPPP
jgi:hypothetical protein